MNNVNLQLLAGETIVWQGNPGPMPPFVRGLKMFYLVFGIIWLGIVASMFSFIPAFFSFIISPGLTFIVGPFVFVAICLIAWRLYKLFVVHAKSSYILTNMRAIVQNSTNGETNSVSLNGNSTVELTLRSGDVGDIIFNSGGIFRYPLPIPFIGKFYNMPIAFFGIENPQDVYNKILQYKKS